MAKNEKSKIWKMSRAIVVEVRTIEIGVWMTETRKSKIWKRRELSPLRFGWLKDEFKWPTMHLELSWWMLLKSDQTMCTRTWKKFNCALAKINIRSIEVKVQMIECLSTSLEWLLAMAIWSTRKSFERSNFVRI